MRLFRLDFFRNLFCKPSHPSSTIRSPLYLPPTEVIQRLKVEITLEEFLAESSEAESLDEVSKEPKKLDLNVTAERESYFGPLVRGMRSSSQSIILHTDNESDLPPAYQTHDHPSWKNLDTLWAIKPLVLDPHLFPSPSIETEFRDALFRLTPEFSYHTEGFLLPIISQGTTLTFKNYSYPDVCHVVEWCLLETQEHAYLKVVGMGRNRDGQSFYYPFNDPNHPSFILVVPKGLSFVQQPPPFDHISRSHPFLNFLKRFN